MSDILSSVLSQTVQVTLLVLVMMTLVDAANVRTRGKLGTLLKGSGRWRQYVVSSLIGAVPGCMGGFTSVSLYVHGMISFGALAGSMAAVSGDEAFVMLAMFPKMALLLFGMLFVIGVVAGWITDRVVRKWNISTCEDCETQQFHPAQEGFVHYLKDHIWQHIIKKHLWKTALWTLGALLVVEVGLRYWNLETLTSQYMIVLLFAGALIGLIPESGPHLIFVTMFANGLIPFSVLFTSTIVQDGHGMLPLLSYSFRDSVKVKAFNFSFGLIFGLILFAFGV
jgi:Putative, 10TM heavy-metal exporter